ncbi:MAG: hypothetical protein WAR79_15880 [Melioribacteraceae bacterium]
MKTKNIKDKEFISEILSSEFKHISNPNFTQETLEKITEINVNKITTSNSGDITFLIPVILYVALSILFSLITLIFSWAHFGQINNVIHSIEMMSILLWHPVTFSILFSFCLLYLMDLFLKKEII